MSDVAARASFEVDLDDIVDVSMRSLRRLPRHRRAILINLIVVGVMGGVLFWFVAPFVFGDGEPTLRIGAAIACGVLASILHGRGTEPRTRRLLRRYLHDAHGEGPHRCDVEVRESGLVFLQMNTTVAIPWSEVEAVNDDAGDIEIGSRSVTGVVRRRAFETDAERDSFLRHIVERAEKARAK